MRLDERGCPVSSVLEKGPTDGTGRTITNVTRLMASGWRRWVFLGTLVLGNAALYLFVGRPEMTLERADPASYKAIYGGALVRSASTRCLLLCAVYSLLCLIVPVLVWLADVGRRTWMNRQTAGRDDGHRSRGR